MFRQKHFCPFSITFPIDKIDKAILKNGELTVFTPRFGTKTPSTIYRQQAVISKGRVIEKNRRQRIYSRRRFGLYPDMAQGIFLLEPHVFYVGVGIGCKVQIASDNKSFTVTTDRQTWFLRAENSLKKAKQLALTNNAILKARAKTKSREYIQWREANVKRCKNS